MFDQVHKLFGPHELQDFPDLQDPQGLQKPFQDVIVRSEIIE